MDLSLVMGYWGSSGGARVYHHTAPINALYALHEALRLVAWLESGLVPAAVDITASDPLLPQLAGEAG